MSADLTMKPLLSLAIMEAVKLALIDSAVPPDNGFWTDEQKVEFGRNVYALPSDAIARMDPGALAQNVACRLLGYGGWEVRGEYAPNMTPRQVFESSIERPDQDVISETIFDLGLHVPRDDNEWPEGDAP